MLCTKRLTEVVCEPPLRGYFYFDKVTVHSEKRNIRYLAYYISFNSAISFSRQVSDCLLTVTSHLIGLI